MRCLRRWAELDTQIIIAQQLGYGVEGELSQIAAQITELRTMLNALRRSLTR
jgi:four helix bundle protein